MYKPLTKDEFQKALDSGFNTEQIISHEKTRKLKSQSIPQILKENVIEAGKKTLGMAKTAANVGLFGLPEIASQKLTGKPFVKEELTPSQKTQASMAGFAFGPAGKLTSAVSKGVSKILPKATGLIPTMARGGITGAVGYGTQLPTPQEAATLEEATQDVLGKAKKGFIAGAATTGILYGVGKGFNYAGQKATKIKQSYRNWAQKNYNAWDEGIANLPKEQIQAGDGMQNFTKKLIDRKLLNPDGSTNPALTTADSKLLKAYESLYRKWANSKSGILNSNDIIDEYMKVKGKFAKTMTQTKIEDRQAAEDIIDAFKDQFKSGSFNKIKANYAVFKNKEEILEKYFQVKSKNPYLTGRAERTITQRLGESQEIKQAQKLAKSELGQTLKGGRVISEIYRIFRNPLARAALYLGVGGAGAKRLLRE